MKGIRVIFLVFFIVLVSIASVKAEVHPPNPENAVATDLQDGDAPPNPDPIIDTPIDSNIVILLFAGLLLGITVVYKNKIKKASI